MFVISKNIANFAVRTCPCSLMDRISDSGSDDRRSIRLGGTKVEFPAVCGDSTFAFSPCGRHACFAPSPPLRFACGYPLTAAGGQGPLRSRRRNRHRPKSITITLNIKVLSNGNRGTLKAYYASQKSRAKIRLSPRFTIVSAPSPGRVRFSRRPGPGRRSGHPHAPCR